MIVAFALTIFAVIALFVILGELRESTAVLDSLALVGLMLFGLVVLVTSIVRSVVA